MSSWKLADLKNRWDSLNNDLNSLSENLAVRSADLPGMSAQSSSEEFNLLVASLRALGADIVNLGSDIKNQTDTLSIEIKHFYDLAREYDSEIDIYRKGREQAFGLYDNLSKEHKELLHEFETMKADHKAMMKSFEEAQSKLNQVEIDSKTLRESNQALASDLTDSHIELMSAKKRVELLEDENSTLTNIKDHESTDRNSLIDQLAKEIKSRNDATVLAEAARNELSRILGEAEEDRRLRNVAEQERDEAVGAVDQLNALIEELKTTVEESEKQYKHEIIMRHKIEENLLQVEAKLKELESTLETITNERDEAQIIAESFTCEKSKILDEKEALVSQIATIASQMAQDKLDSAKLMDTLKTAQEDLDAAKRLSEDSTEKAKGMERVVNQLISEKGEFEAQTARAKSDLEKMIEDNKDVVGVRQRLEEKVTTLENQLGEVSKLFDNEKNLKSESVIAQKSTEMALEKAQNELLKVKEKEAEILHQRDEAKANLESVQKILQSERQSKIEIEKSHSALSNELMILKGKFQDESRLKDDLVKSLDAETRSKNEIMKEMENMRKNAEKLNINFEKTKGETDGLKEKMKDMERANKDLSKQVDELRKDLSKGSTETEKATRKIEEIQRKLDVESAQTKENEKGWNSEKSEHEKTYKAYFEEKGKAEKLERELDAVKSSLKQLENSIGGEKSEHGKTYKAYEAERDARGKMEAEIANLKAQIAELNGQVKSAQTEKSAVEKKAQKLENQVSDLSSVKADAASVKREFDSERKQLESQFAADRKQLESQLMELQQEKRESEKSMESIRKELENNKIKMNNFELENKQLLKRLEKFAAELAEEQRVKNQLLAATAAAVPASTSPTNAPERRRSSLDNFLHGAGSPIERHNRAISGSISK